MADGLISALTFVSVLGCGLIAGVFFAFSTFVMGALGRLPAAQGIRAMQSINVAVINPIFLGTLFGTAGCCAVLLIAALLRWQAPGAGLLILGSLLYLVGTIAVTMAGNVPLNNALGVIAPDSAEGATTWADYLKRWTGWNHVRTAAATAATGCFVAALVRAAAAVG